MSRSARLTRFFGDDDHVFALRIGECEELQEALDCGLMVAAGRCANVDVVAIRHVLRLGLIGGGMTGELASRLVRRHLVPPELIAGAQIATDVIDAALRGAPDEPLGERVGEAMVTTSPTASWAMPPSTEREQPSAGASTASAPPPSGNSAQPSPAGRKRTAQARKSV